MGDCVPCVCRPVQLDGDIKSLDNEDLMRHIQQVSKNCFSGQSPKKLQVEAVLSLARRQHTLLRSLFAVSMMIAVDKRAVARHWGLGRFSKPQPGWWEIREKKWQGGQKKNDTSVSFFSGIYLGVTGSLEQSQYPEWLKEDDNWQREGLEGLVLYPEEEKN
jgi:hypothetical protein